MSFGDYIHVLAKQPGHPFHWFWVKNSLKDLQNFVGGYIEAATVAPGIAVICNEEGRLLDLDLNVFVNGTAFVGPILIVGAEGDEFTDLPSKALDAIAGVLVEAAPNPPLR